jgi:hypothetical protein
MTGLLTVAPNLGEALSLKGGSSDHVYLGFYARSANQNARSGYIGYDAAGTDVLNIVNARPGGLVAVNGTILPIERGDINFNSNWNSYTTPGYYQVASGGSSAANTPPAIYQYGILLVIKAGAVITQLYTQHIGSGTFVRQIYDGSWGPWVELSNNFTNRFVVQGQLGGTTSTSLTPGSYYSLSWINIYIPSGKRLYLRRLRYLLSSSAATANVSCGSYSYTSSVNYGDISLDVAMSDIGAWNVAFNIRAYNPTSNNVNLSPADTVWAELEIR